MAHRWSQRRSLLPPPKVHFGYIDPQVLLLTLEDPLLAIDAEVVLQAASECAVSLDAHDLFFGSWFSLFAEAIESEPQRLRARLGVPDFSADMC